MRQVVTDWECDILCALNYASCEARVKLQVFPFGIGMLTFVLGSSGLDLPAPCSRPRKNQSPVRDP